MIKFFFLNKELFILFEYLFKIITKFLLSVFRIVLLDRIEEPFDLSNSVSLCFVILGLITLSLFLYIYRYIYIYIYIIILLNIILWLKIKKERKLQSVQCIATYRSHTATYRSHIATYRSHIATYCTLSRPTAPYRDLPHPIATYRTLSRPTAPYRDLNKNISYNFLVG